MRVVNLDSRFRASVQGQDLHAEVLLAKKNQSDYFLVELKRIRRQKPRSKFEEFFGLLTGNRFSKPAPSVEIYLNAEAAEKLAELAEAEFHKAMHA